MPSIKTTFGVDFAQHEGQSLLDAALQAGLSFPYSCRYGRCGACRCKVIEGKSEPILEELGLSLEEKAQGWILGCARQAKSNLLIEIEDLTGVAVPKVKTLPARISSLERLTSNVLCVRLRLPPASKFEWLPGQYIEVIGANNVRRAYSVANPSFSNSELVLHVGAVDGGEMSQYWFGKAKVGDLLRLKGPLGTFFLRQSRDLDLFFLATGTGLAPIIAMLGSIDVLEEPLLPRSVTVIWGARTRQDLYLDLSNTLVKTSFFPVLSRASSEWTGKRGYVQHVLISLKPDFANAAVYACGSDAMIRHSKLLLTSSGLSESRFYSDAFVSSSPN